MWSAERVQGSHISLDPFCVKFTCSPTSCVGSSPGRLFSTHSPPTCRPGGLRLCTSASEPTLPNADDLSKTFPYLPPRFSHPILPHVRIHASTQPCFCRSWFKMTILSIRGICFFNSVFRSWQLFQIFLWAGLTRQRSGREVSLDDEVDPNHWSTRESAANKHWVKTKTGGPVKPLECSLYT